MDPATIGSIVNLGSAGAVIIVVMIFLKSIKERDQEWRDFFTTLNSSNAKDVCELTEQMSKLVSLVDNLAKSLDQHDKRVEERIRAASEVATQPRKGAAK